MYCNRTCSGSEQFYIYLLTEWSERGGALATMWRVYTETSFMKEASMHAHDEVIDFACTVIGGQMRNDLVLFTAL